MSKRKKILNINKNKNKKIEKIDKSSEILVNEFDEEFAFTHTLRPPYDVILDTNFINDCIRKKKDLKNELWTVLDANVKLHVPECVIGELEKLGRPYRVALALIRSDDVLKLECDHKGTYADDCIIERVTKHRCYIVATSDVGLRQRIKKIPGVPVAYFRGNRSFVERFIPASYY